MLDLMRQVARLKASSDLLSCTPHYIQKGAAYSSDFKKTIFTSSGTKHESTPIPPEPQGPEIEIQHTTILDYDNLSARARDIEEQVKMELHQLRM